jgi:hypothetical protein
VSLVICSDATGAATFVLHILRRKCNPLHIFRCSSKFSILCMAVLVGALTISFGGCSASLKSPVLPATKAPDPSATGVPAQLEFVTQPADAAAGATLAPAISVSILDAQGNLATSASNTVKLDIQANPGNATLQGSTSVAAVAGSATFSALSLNSAANGYTITATSAGLTSATSTEFTIGQPLPQEQAAQADAFVDSIGVGTHLSYNDTPYFTAWPGVLNALTTLGVRHIRDGFWNWDPSSPYISEHKALAAAGIHCTYVVPINSTGVPESIEQFSPEVGDMEALEAPNECDLAGNCGPTAQAGIDNMLGFLPAIDVAGTKLGIPVVGPSFTQQSSYVSAGNISSEITNNNLHVYFGGRNPGSTGWGDFDPEGNSYGSFPWWLDQANIDAPNIPVEITETGYVAYPTTNTPYNIPESVESSYTPRTLLLAFKHGIKHTFLYELLDEVSSPGYGILRSDLTPKPAFTAVENLIANLSDKGSPFTPGKLAYSIEGGGPNLNHLLLQKRDGSYWLILWLEEPTFDPASDQPITIIPQRIILTLAAPDARQVLRWDARGNMTWSNATMQGDTLALTVSEQISIVKIVK